MIALFGGPLDGQVKDCDVCGRVFEATIKAKKPEDGFVQIQYAWERIWEHDGHMHATAVFVEKK